MKEAKAFAFETKETRGLERFTLNSLDRSKSDLAFHAVIIGRVVLPPPLKTTAWETTIMRLIPDRSKTTSRDALVYTDLEVSTLKSKCTQIDLGYIYLCN